MGKVYRRITKTYDSLAVKTYTKTDHISVKEAMAIVNSAMIGDDRRKVATMSSGRGQHVIKYKSGVTVRLTEVDEPKAEPVAETEDWASTRTGNVEHRFDKDGRALCNRRLRAYDRYVSQTDRRVRRTRSEIENGPYASLYTFCPSCSSL